MTRLVLIPSKQEFEALYPGGGEQIEGPFYGFRNDHAVWAVCGIGVGVSGLICEKLLNTFDEVSEVFLLGIAGAFPESGFELCDIVQAKSECFADLGYRDHEGFHNLDDMGFAMLHAAHGTLGTQTLLDVWDEDLPKGNFISVNQITASRETADLLYEHYEADVENMEGASVALACAMRQIRFYQVRAISNMCGPRNKALWDIKGALTALKDWYNKQPISREAFLENLEEKEEEAARKAYYAYLDEKHGFKSDGYDEAFRNLF